MQELNKITKRPTKRSGTVRVSTRFVRRGTDKSIGSGKHLEVKNGHALVVKDVQETQGVGRAIIGQSSSAGKVIGGKVHRRTGPKGKRAIVSDSAVDSIAEDMEKRTRLAIRTIGRSTGF